MPGCQHSRMVSKSGQVQRLTPLALNSFLFVLYSTVTHQHSAAVKQPFCECQTIPAGRAGDLQCVCLCTLTSLGLLLCAV